MRILLLLAFFLAGCAKTPGYGGEAKLALGSQTAPKTALTEEIDAVIDAAVAEGFGGQLVIAKDGEIIYRRAAGFAHNAKRVAVRHDTLFHVASVTKYITAALALKAQEEGAVDLSASISDLAPDTKLEARGVTFADLLAHRSGLGSSYAAETVKDSAKALAAIDAAPIDEDKIGAFKYSNDGYDLLAILLERAWDAPYETLVREKLFRPAHLSGYGFWGEPGLTNPQRVSRPLRRVPGSFLKRNYGFIGSAGLLITATDLVRWQAALNDGKVLSEASLAEYFKPRGALSIGEATYGAFLIDRPGMGGSISVQGTEDWGDNAYLMDYRACGIILAVVTSRGPLEKSGRPLFRDSIRDAIEKALAPGCGK